MNRVKVATSDDLAVLRFIFNNPKLNRRYRQSAWFRFETIQWYHAYIKHGLPLRFMDKRVASAVEEYIIERLAKGLQDEPD